jgi:hypothetical protein
MGCCSIREIPPSISSSLKKQSDELANISKAVIAMEESLATVKVSTRAKMTKLSEFVDWQEEVVNILKQLHDKARNLKEERAKVRTEMPSESQISEHIVYESEESSCKSEIDLDDLNVIISGHHDKLKEYIDELRRESQQNTTRLGASG